MLYRPFGPLIMQAPVIGQGTWNIETADRNSAIAALRRGLDLGMTHIDTAEMYGSGKSEEIVGEAVAGRRHEVFLVSKVLPSNAGRAGAIEACEKSLARLKVDQLDCYLLHWRGRYPLEETVAVFEKLLEQGKIASWGVSNFDVDDLDEIARIAPAGHLTCNQVLYHLRERAIEHAVIPWCHSHNVAVVAYSPFGSGDFPTPNSDSGRVLQAVAERNHATARQTALSFLTRLPSVFAIPKTSSAVHAQENAAAGDLVLSEQDIGQLDVAFPRGKRPLSLPII